MINGSKVQGNGITTAVHCTIITVITATPVFLPGASVHLIQEDVNFGIGGIGLVFTLYWLGSLVGSFKSRESNNLLPMEKTTGLMVLASGMALAFMGFYPSIGMWIGAIIGGISYGYSQPFTNLLIMRNCASSISGFAFGLKQAAIPASTLLCSLSIPILAIPFGWKSLFKIAAMISVTYAIFTLICSGKTKVQKSIKTKEESLPLNAHLIFLGVAGALGAMIGNSLGAFLISSLFQNGFTLVAASLIASLASITNIIVRIVAGIATDRLNCSPQKLLIAMFGIGMLGTIFLATTLQSIQVVGAILAYGGGWGWAGLLHYVTGLSYPGKEKQATAVSQMGVSVGAAFGPLLFGWLFSSFGPTQAWLVTSIVGLLACTFVILSRKLQVSKYYIERSKSQI